jgi:DNA-binding NtrC family response regulator
LNNESILVVDDDYKMLNAVVLFLRTRTGINVLSSHTYAAALGLLKGGSINVLLTDCHINTNEDGVALANRAQRMNSDIAIVVMSGDHPADLLSCHNFICLQKPFGSVQLLDAIEAARIAAKAPPKASRDNS